MFGEGSKAPPGTEQDNNPYESQSAANPVLRVGSNNPLLPGTTGNPVLQVSSNNPLRATSLENPMLRRPISPQMGSGEYPKTESSKDPYSAKDVAGAKDVMGHGSRGEELPNRFFGKEKKRPNSPLGV